MSKPSPLQTRWLEGAWWIAYNLPFRDADWLMERWHAIHNKTGVRLRTGPYPWRHTYVSNGLTNGQNVNWIAKQCGHSVMMVERVYGKWIAGSEALDQIELGKVYKDRIKHTKLAD